MKPEIAELIERYRMSPEFMFADLKDIHQTGMTGDTLLHSAVIRAELNDVRLLLAEGARVNAIGDLGYTPLHNAASRGLTDIVSELLRAGAKLEIKNEFSQTALDLAELGNHIATKKLLKNYKR